MYNCPRMRLIVARDWETKPTGLPRWNSHELENSRSATPLVVDRKQHIVSPEILGWSIATLASAWSQWVFTSKSNEQSAYQTDQAFDDDEGRLAARKNVKLALPYVHSSIISALNRGMHIGNSSITNFEPKPEIEPQFLELDKDFKSGHTT